MFTPTPNRTMPSKLSLIGLVAVLLGTSFTTTNADFFPVTLVDLFILAVTAVTAIYLLGHETLVWFSKLEKWLLGCVLMLLAVVFSRYVAAWSAPYHAPGLKCFVFPAMLAKFECLTALDFSLNYGLRQNITHLTALSLFVVTFLGVRRGLFGKAWPTLLLPALLWGFYTGLSILGLVDDTLVGSNFFVGLTRKLSSSTAVVANPGWLWPLLGPAIALTLALTIRPSAVWARLGWVAVALMLIVAVFASGQRGGYLSMAALLICYITIAVISMLPYRRWRLMALPLLAGGGAYTFYWFFSGPYYRQVVYFLDMRLRKSIFSPSNSRLEMWQLGLEKFLEVPWVGTGYASWMHLHPKINLPTAHNFWVQTLVEHGVLVALPIFALLGYVIWVLTARRGLPTWQRAAGILLTISVIMTSLVQEFDHVTAIYYQIAVIAGILYGLATVGQQPHDAGSPRRGTWRRCLAVASAFCALLAVAGALKFSWGGYGFGPAPGGDLTRAFRPWGQITASAHRDGRLYSVANLNAIAKKSHAPYADGSKDGRPSDFATYAYSKNQVILANGPRQWGRTHRYTTDQFTFRRQMLHAFSLTQPFFQTNLGIFDQRDTYPWEGSGTQRRGERWCRGSCKILLKAREDCRRGPQQLTIDAPRPDIAQSGGLAVVIQTAIVVDNPADMLTPHWDHQPLTHQITLSFTSPQQQSVPLPHDKDEWGWIVALATDRTYQPSTTKQGDMRQLGIKLIDLTCVPASAE